MGDLINLNQRRQLKEPIAAETRQLALEQEQLYNRIDDLIGLARSTDRHGKSDKLDNDEP